MKALVSALERKDCGVGLDVFEKEPRLTGPCKLENVVCFLILEAQLWIPRTDGCGGCKECHHDAERKSKNIVNPEVFKSPEYLRRVKG
jgi:lactate dehydrogenase-like 2-hydroxyacid dehydrogenase